MCHKAEVEFQISLNEGWQQLYNSEEHYWFQNSMGMEF